MTASPYAHYDQVFVIMRTDASPTREQTAETGIHLVKALWTHTEAEMEVARLNQSSHDAGSSYFWKAVRLERRAATV
jgi:hypothetical protein